MNNALVVQFVSTMLKQNSITFEFTKADGTTRVLNGTLQSELLPEINKDNTEERKAAPPAVIKLFDVDKQAWRSIKPESIISIIRVGGQFSFTFTHGSKVVSFKNNIVTMTENGKDVQVTNFGIIPLWTHITNLTAWLNNE